MFIDFRILPWHRIPRRVPRRVPRRGCMLPFIPNCTSAPAPPTTAARRRLLTEDHRGSYHQLLGPEKWEWKTHGNHLGMIRIDSNALILFLYIQYIYTIYIYIQYIYIYTIYIYNIIYIYIHNIYTIYIQYIFLYLYIYNIYIYIYIYLFIYIYIHTIYIYNIYNIYTIYIYSIYIQYIQYIYIYNIYTIYIYIHIQYIYNIYTIYIYTIYIYIYIQYIYIVLYTYTHAIGGDRGSLVSQVKGNFQRIESMWLPDLPGRGRVWWGDLEHRGAKHRSNRCPILRFESVRTDWTEYHTVWWLEFNHGLWSEDTIHLSGWMMFSAFFGNDPAHMTRLKRGSSARKTKTPKTRHGNPKKVYIYII